VTLPTVQPTTDTLVTGGAELTFDVRRNEASSKLPLLLVGSPMGAGGFGTLAGHFADRTVITYDPRGTERSRRTDDRIENTPQEHADDMRRLLEHLRLGPVDLFASSGGAVNALELTVRHPDLLRTVVAHEPPLVRYLPDAEVAEKVTRDMHADYQANGIGGAMAKFISLVSHEGELTDGYLARPAPDPSMFGLPTEDDGSRDDALLGRNLLTCTLHELDLEALRGVVRGGAAAEGRPRLVLAAGAESRGQLARRATEALAERLGAEVVDFPSDHGGFLGGEYGQRGDPDAFAAKLREVLNGAV